MTTAPLPPEEIERLKAKSRKVGGLGSISVEVPVSSLDAALAEIESGRAGAERVRVLEAALTLAANRFYTLAAAYRHAGESKRREDLRAWEKEARAALREREEG